jgi:hypothetical protein
VGALPPWADAEVVLAAKDVGAGDDAVADAAFASVFDDKLFRAAFAVDMAGALDAPCPCVSVDVLLAALAVLLSDADPAFPALTEVAVALRARFLLPASAIASPALVAAAFGAAGFGACTTAAPDSASTSGDGALALTGLLAAMGATLRGVGRAVLAPTGADADDAAADGVPSGAFGFCAGTWVAMAA